MTTTKPKRKRRKRAGAPRTDKVISRHRLTWTERFRAELARRAETQSMATIAEETGLSRQSIHSLATGRCRVNILTAEILARYFGWDLE